jgi:hypothetical protein
MMKHGVLLKTTKATEKERGQIKVVRVDVQATTKVSGTATAPGWRWGRLKGGMTIIRVHPLISVYG